MVNLDLQNSGYGGLFGWLGQPEQKTLPHMHSDVELNFVLQGSVTYLVGGRVQVLSEGDLALFWAVTPHCIIALNKKPKMGVVHIPLGEFLRWGLPPEFVNPILHGQVLHRRSEQVALDRMQFRVWAADMGNGFSPVSAEAQHTALLEIQARVWRMARIDPLHGAVPPALSPDPLDLPKIEQVAIFVALNYASPITVEDIARVVGLHPNYVMNLFRRTMGQTLTNYLTLHRLAHAQRLLISSDHSILDVALDSGFGSLSRFYAAFKLNMGTTPKHYRALYGITRGEGARS